MDKIKISSTYLALAVQTVLHEHKDRLDLLISNDDEQLLGEIAQEIAMRTAAFQKITDRIICEMATSI